MTPLTAIAVPTERERAMSLNRHAGDDAQKDPGEPPPDFVRKVGPGDVKFGPWPC